MTSTIAHASSLLTNWTSILSRTEHTQRLILNPGWSGGNADIAAVENEAREKTREKERKVAEEARRREELERKRALEEERRAAGAVTPSKGVGTRGRTGMRTGVGRGVGRGRGVGTGAGIGSSGVGTAGTGATPGRGTATTGRAAISHYGRVRGRASTVGRGTRVGTK